MQTNKEFLDALDIRPEDGFLAVAVRRSAAWQLGKPVAELETDTVGEPDFLLGPWDHRFFLIRIEEELQCKLPINKTPFPGDDVISVDWFRGPAIRMPMGEWTKVAVEQFLGPIRDEISCPKNWTPFESEDLRPTGSTTWSDRLRHNLFVVLCIIPVLLILLALPGCVFHDWAQKVSKLSLLLFFLWPGFFYVALRMDQYLFLKRDMEKILLKEPVTKLLGTVTFRTNMLYFFDGETPEGEIEILPGDYRFFLIYGMEDFDWPSYAVMTNGTEIPSLNSAIDIVTESLEEENRQVTEVVVDSGMISFVDAPDPTQLSWKPGPNSKTVKQVLLRDDGSIGGLKLYPSYGDGGYRAYVRKDHSRCDIVLELIAPEE